VKATHAHLAFNRGLVSRYALARVDLKRMALAASTHTNYMTKMLGPMMLRPGWQYIHEQREDEQAVHIPFVFSESDTAIIELTDGVMRVAINDVIITRPAVTSKFNRYNGAAFIASSDTESLFADATDVGYWKDNDESGATSELLTGGGYLSLLGDGNASAIRDRSIAVVETNVEHRLEIVVNRGPVILRIGTTEGDDDLLADLSLRAGEHNISVTPTTATMFVRLSNSRDVISVVDSVTLGQAAADMELLTPWAAADLRYVRSTQSADVTFVACRDIAQKRIERQGQDNPRSWSVVDYAPEDGPFRDLNTGPVRMKVDALSGDATLTAERAYFKSTNVGSLFSLASAGQEVADIFTSDNVFTDPIRVTGVDTGRIFNVSVSGAPFTATTTVTLQRSVAEPGDWTDVTNYTSTVVATPTDDGLDNQIIYYRLGIKTGNYTAADTISAQLTYSAGSITGIGRVTAFTSETEVSLQILSNFGKQDQYTADWREGDWSPRRGYPSAVELDAGRLCWAGKSFEWLSVSDGFDSFDDTIEGDDGPIRRSIGKGPIDNVNWLLSANNLLFGLESSVQVARSSSLDEPLTQSRFGLRPVANKAGGTAAVQAVLVDTSAIYVASDERRVLESVFDGTSYNFNPPTDLTALVPEVGAPGFRRLAVQNAPDRRLHFVRSDGTVAILVLDRLENITCWLEIETDGVIEDVVILPAHPDTRGEDRVYYSVKRTINGVTKRYLEKWATEDKARGATDTRLADSFVYVAGAGTTITGLDHLEGEAVVVWQDGVCPEDAVTGDPKTYTVSGGSITLDTAVTTSCCVGLPYTAQWKSAKGAVRDAQQMLLNQRQKADQIGFILADTHHKGVKYGTDFDNLDHLPGIEQGKRVATDYIWTDYDFDAMTLSGTWSTDARICLQSQAPRPATILAITIGEQGNAR
jgi:hypothetical protein